MTESGALTQPSDFEPVTFLSGTVRHYIDRTGEALDRTLCGLSTDGHFRQATWLALTRPACQRCFSYLPASVNVKR